MFLLLGCEGEGVALEGEGVALEEEGVANSSCWLLALGSTTGNHRNHFQLVQSYSQDTLL